MLVAAKVERATPIPPKTVAHIRCSIRPTSIQPASSLRQTHSTSSHWCSLHRMRQLLVSCSDSARVNTARGSSSTSRHPGHVLGVASLLMPCRRSQRPASARVRNAAGVLGLAYFIEYVLTGSAGRRGGRHFDTHTDP